MGIGKHEAPASPAQPWLKPRGSNRTIVRSGDTDKALTPVLDIKLRPEYNL